VGFRFSKRVTLLPGLHLNLGLKGASISVGRRGANVTIGRRGVYGNVGLPGTGLSYRTRLDRPSPNLSRSAAPAAREILPPERFKVIFAAQGVVFTDDSDQPLDAETIRVIKRRCRDQLIDAFRGRADASTALIDMFEGVHRGTPPPTARCAPPNRPAALRPKPPKPADMNEPGIAASERERRRAANAAFNEDLSRWRVEQVEAQDTEPDLAAIAQPVLDRLTPIEWPRETHISLDVDPTGRVLLMDVDLPELEDLPDSREILDERNVDLRLKPITAAARDRLYATHVHGILFRLIGEAFAAQGALEEVRISGYTQRLSPATGAVQDVYVLSARTRRDLWMSIDFSHLDRVDPVVALERFELRRRRSARGTLASIEPFT
jgi:hypothetical protein